MNDPVCCLIRDLTNSILHRLFTLSLEGFALSFEGRRLALTKEGPTRASPWFVAVAAAFAARSAGILPALLLSPLPPFYRRLEIFKLLTDHGLPYFLIMER